MKTFLRTLFLIQAVLFLSSIKVKAQVFKWANSITVSAGTYNSQGIFVDAKGNSFITGYFSGIGTFDSIQLTSFGSRDVFIAKFDSSGNCLWAKQAGGTDVDEGWGISVDTSGNSYVTGDFIGTATFGSIQLNSFGANGTSDIFIAKYDPQGNCLWAKQAGSNTSDFGYAISVNANGDCFVTGGFKGIGTFGGFVILSSSMIYYDIFTARYDQNGNFIWVKRNGYNNDSYGNGISSDANGNSYVIGYSSPNVVITKYDPSGNILWEDFPRGYSSGISVDAQGDSYVTGYFAGTTNFGGNAFPLTSYGGWDIFIAKYNPNGNCLWAKKAGNSSDDFSYGISTDAQGNSYITGNFKGTSTFGSIKLTGSNSHTNIFISKYDSSGNCMWAKKANGSGNAQGNGISVNANGNAYITGNFTGTTLFGNNQLADTIGAFVAKIAWPSLNITSPIGNEIWHTNSVYSIKWNSDDDSTLAIDLTTNSGVSWLPVVSSVSANIGYYVYTVPSFQTSGNCKMRLSSLIYNNISLSPNPFIISDTANALLDTNLVAYFPFNGNALDSSRKANNGVVTGAVLTSDRFGKPNRAYYFNGSGNYIQIPNSTSLSLTNNFTISAWVKPNAFSAYDGIVSKFQAAGQTSYSLRLGPGSPYSNIDFIGVSTTTQIAQSSWTHIAVKLENDTAKIFINGEFVKQGKLPYALIQTSNPVTIGVDYLASPRYFNGSIDEVRIYNKVLSDIEIKSLYDVFIAAPTNLIASTGSPKQIILNWADKATNENNYVVQRKQGDSLSANQYLTIAVITANSNSFIDNLDLQDTTKYSYRVFAKTDDTVSAFSNQSVVQTPLPVELVAFNYKVEESQIVLNWTTATEQNNFGFEIERQIGNDTWVKIGLTKGYGTSVIPHKYQFADRNSSFNNEKIVNYRLKQLDMNGGYKYSNILSIKLSNIPQSFSISQNYPNPFNPSTIIKYTLPYESNVNIKFYNSLGQCVHEVNAGTRQPGYYELNFNASGLASGIYFYSIKAISTDGKKDISAVKKMILLK